MQGEHTQIVAARQHNSDWPPVVRAIDAHHKALTNSPCPWNGRIFGQLKHEMSMRPKWTAQDWIRCIENRQVSDINPGEPPERFIPKLRDFHECPLDRYGKPKAPQVSARTLRNRDAGQGYADSVIREAAASDNIEPSAGNIEVSEPQQLELLPGCLQREGGVKERRRVQRRPLWTVKTSDQKLVRVVRKFGHYSTVMANVYMPTQPVPIGTVWVRENGKFRLAVGNAFRPLPSGSMTRMLIWFLTSWSFDHRHEPGLLRVNLGTQPIAFLEHELGIEAGGGERGTVAILKRELLRLLSTEFEMVGPDPDEPEALRSWWIPLARDCQWWGKVKDFKTVGLFPSWLELSADFRRLFLDRAVPVPREALTKLCKWPLSMDQFCWLSHKYGYLRSAQLVPWLALYQQFSLPTVPLRHFKARFTESLNRVRDLVYKTASFDWVDDKGLLLRPSPTPIAKKLKILEGEK